MTPLRNLKNNEMDIAENEQVPIFNEKFFVLLGIDTFLHFKALFKGYAMECGKPEQIIIDEKFMKRLTGAVIKKRALQVSVPEIYDVSVQGTTGVYFLLDSCDVIRHFGCFRYKAANCSKIHVFRWNQSYNPRS